MRILELKNVTYQVGDKQILQDVSFSVEANDFLTLLGPSGAGKSTILKLIANLINPSIGQILYQGQDIMKLDPLEYRRSVSYCFQQPSLFGKSIRDNLIFPFQIRKKAIDENRIEELLTEVDLSNDFLNKDITSLSGGEKQRVALIRNLMFLPKVLLLDEITSGLDEDSKALVHQLIKRIVAEDVTIIQVTHDQEEIEAAGKVIQVEKGGIIK